MERFVAYPGIYQSPHPQYLILVLWQKRKRNGGRIGIEREDVQSVPVNLL